MEEEREVNEMAERYADSVDFSEIKMGQKTAKKFTPFRTKYESGDSTNKNAQKIHTVEQELSKLKELQSQVVSMQETMEETIQREVQKTKEKEIKEMRARYKSKIREIEAQCKQREEQIKKEYEEKVKRIMEKMKEKAKHAIVQRVAEEVEKAKKTAEKKILEVKLRDKAVIDKLSQMYIDLKEKYRKDIQRV